MPRSSVSRRRPAWWARPGLDYRQGQLQVAGHSLAALAAEHGTPLYVYDAARVRANLTRLRAALAAARLEARVFYAMKSNRHAPLLRALRATGDCGIDTCSPAEVAHARDCGFSPGEISFTGTSLSDADLRALLAHDGLILNLDSQHDIARVGALAPGRRIGLRINPGLGIGYRRNQLLRYAGGRGTKFGLHAAQFPAALRAARRAGLIVEGLHFHTGCGYLTPQLPVLDRIFSACGKFLAQVPGLRYVNLGGGLGIPLVSGDRPLDLQRWSRLVARHFGGRSLEVWCEPGDYLVKDAGALVLEANTVERKGGTLFAGVNGGFQLHIEPAFYQLPLVPVPVREPSPRARLQPTTLAGHINEALDLLHVDAPLPPLANGDLIAFLNAGGYGASMASNHCMRGGFTEVLLEPAPVRPPRADARAVLATLRAELGSDRELAKVPADEVGQLAAAAGDNARLKRWLKRRMAGEPLAHIIGEFQFRGRPFHIDKRAYVTDPELTYLVDAVLRHARALQKEHGRPPLLAEFGVGCGSLAISLKLALPDATIVGLELDPDALRVAERNLQRHRTAVRLIESDLFDAWPSELPAPDLIYGDPPWGDATTLYDETARPDGHYHAMPAASAFPLGGRTGVHTQILHSVAARGWRSHILLNGGVLPRNELAAVARGAAWSRIEKNDAGILFLHCRMH